LTEPVSSLVEEWRGFQSILCSVDFSEHSRVALRYAEVIARKGNGSIAVLYSEDPLLVAAGRAAAPDAHIVQRDAEALRGFVSTSWAEPARMRPPVKSQVFVGPPGETIVNEAAREGSDLIVLGTHGLTGANRLLIGSTTLAVLQRTPIPVLAVPLLHHHAARDPGPGWPGDRILTAIDLDEGCSADVDAAVRVARWFRASVTLVHVISDAKGPADSADLPAHDRIRVAQAREHINALAAAHPGIVTATRIVCGNPADEIAAIVATDRIGLVMMSLRDRHGWFGAGRGSVSYHLLTHTVAPVLAHPPHWRPL